MHKIVSSDITNFSTQTYNIVRLFLTDHQAGKKKEIIKNKFHANECVQRGHL